MEKPLVCLIKLWERLSESLVDLVAFSFQENFHCVLRVIEEQNSYFTVPYTDTGGLVEKTKAIGRKMVKELGKKSRRNLWEMPCLN